MVQVYKYFVSLLFFFFNSYSLEVLEYGNNKLMFLNKWLIGISFENDTDSLIGFKLKKNGTVI